VGESMLDSLPMIYVKRLSHTHTHSHTHIRSYTFCESININERNKK